MKMDEILTVLKEDYIFEIIKKDTDYVVVRGNKSSMDKFTKKFNSALTESLISKDDIKIYHTGSEKQFNIYKLFFIFKTSMDEQKLVEIFKNKENTLV